MDDMYEILGVDSGKKEVRSIFKKRVDNDFPGAFVNIVRDPFHIGRAFTQHMDGDGSKLVQRLLMFKEIGDPIVIRGAVDDAVSMNLGDIAAAGFVKGKIVITDVINVNGFNVPKAEIMEQIGVRFEEIKEMYRDFGFQLFFLGGETADLPHQVQTAVFDVGVYAEAEEVDIIAGNNAPGDKIYGFASDGQAFWESEPNSGIMSNGLTLARVKLMHESYTDKFPKLRTESCRYEGRFQVEKYADGLGMSVGQALISPTRQWAILIKFLIEELEKNGIRKMLHGISLNSGGGATKISHVGNSILYKKNMLLPPNIFKIIQSESGETWKNMYKTFNCGIGIDVVGEDSLKFKKALEIVSFKTGVKLYELGECGSLEGDDNKVKLTTPYGVFNY